MEFKDYYQTLGVAKNASEKEIEQAYRKLARKHHPDVNPGDKSAEARFKEINEAYEVLGDADKRKKYDELGANWRQYEQARESGQGWPPGASPFGDAAGGQGGAWNINMGGPGYRTMTEEEMQELFGNQDPFSDFFNTFFGGGGAAREGAPWSRRPRSAESKGPRHRASGGADARGSVPRRHAPDLDQTERARAQRRRPDSGGGQRRLARPCRRRRRVRIERGGGGRSLPAGADPSASRVRAQGRRPAHEDRAPLTTAVLGGEAQVPTITGTVRLKIPETTQSGQIFRLKGHGMPVVGKPDARGELYTTVEVQLPRSLTPEQRQHYEALAKLEKLS